VNAPAPGAFLAPPPPPPPAGPAKEKGNGPIALGAVGGIVALFGVLIGWTLVQTCASAGGFFSMCVTVPLSVPLGSYDAMLGIAPTVAMVCALGGIVALLLKKPVTGLAASAMGALALIFAVIFMVNFAGVEAAIATDVGGGASASVKVAAGFGLYVTIIGGLLLAIAGFMQWSQLKAPAAEAAKATTA
jgi:hypothetical protein